MFLTCRHRKHTLVLVAFGWTDGDPSVLAVGCHFQLSSALVVTFVCTSYGLYVSWLFRAFGDEMMSLFAAG